MSTIRGWSETAQLPAHSKQTYGRGRANRHESCFFPTHMAVIAESMTRSLRFPVEAGWGAGGFPLILSFSPKEIGSGMGHRSSRLRMRISFVRASSDGHAATSFFEVS